MTSDTNPEHIIPAPPDLAVTVSLDEVRQAPRRFRLQPAEAQLAEIATFLGLDGLMKLNVDLEAVALPGRRFAVRGSVHAAYRQTCVVSLQPMNQKMALEVNRIFQRGEIETTVDADPDEEDVEPLETEELDIGAVMLEEMSLDIDPHPMLAGAKAPKHRVQREESAEKDSPFAILAQLKDTKT